jgi:hypothetical protein
MRGQKIAPWTQRSLSAAAIVATALLVAALCRERFRQSIGIDFYQYWAVGRAVRLSPESLGSPYTPEGGARYAGALRPLAEGTADARLHTVASWRSSSGFDLTATPLLYTVCAFIPAAGYTRTLALFTCFEALCFAAGVVSLARLFGGGWFVAGLLALLLLAAYDPIASDLRVANIAGLQLLAIASALRLATLRRPTVAQSAGLLSLLVLATLLKPNLLLITVALALSASLRLPLRTLARAAMGAAVVGVAAVALSSFFFDSSRVWLDWYRHVYGADSNRLAYPPWTGNCAAAVVLAPWLGLKPSGASLVLSALLVGSVIVALAARSKAASERVRPGVAVLRDPEIVAAGASAATLAIPVLVWVHYEILLLVPCLWLILAPRGRYARWLGVLSLLASAGTAAKLVLIPLGRAELVPLVHAASWIPAWIALLAVVSEGDGPRGRRRQDSRPPAGDSKEGIAHESSAGRRSGLLGDLRGFPRLLECTLGQEDVVGIVLHEQYGFRSAHGAGSGGSKPHGFLSRLCLPRGRGTERLPYSGRHDSAHNTRESNTVGR